VTNGRRENARQRDYYHGLGHCALPQHVLTLIALNALPRSFLFAKDEIRSRHRRRRDLIASILLLHR
jgi:hypothetical protein